MADVLLDASGLSKRFGLVTVADSLDFRVSVGESVGIVGPNGAGKSSLFNLVTGDLRPDAGTIVFAGVDVTRERSDVRVRRGMGRTYQIPRPFAGMTVFENALVGAQQGATLSGRPALLRAAEALEITGLAGSANVDAGRLRLLDRKRLEVARAWASGPKVLLLDEVAGGLTEPEVEVLVTLIRSIHRSGVAIVWIEHVVQALLATVDRLVCLAGGRFVADGSPTEVFANREVRELYLGVGAEADPAESAA